MSKNNPLPKHTPGPFYGVYPTFSREKQEAYIEISIDSGITHASDKDMTLFAAAPEMLKQLRKLVLEMVIGTEEYNSTWEIIKKAEGWK